jgi:hypothetical protein
VANSTPINMEYQFPPATYGHHQLNPAYSGHSSDISGPGWVGGVSPSYNFDHHSPGYNNFPMGDMFLHNQETYLESQDSGQNINTAVNMTEPDRTGDVDQEHSVESSYPPSPLQETTPQGNQSSHRPLASGPPAVPSGESSVARDERPQRSGPTTNIVALKPRRKRGTPPIVKK